MLMTHNQVINYRISLANKVITKDYKKPSFIDAKRMKE